MEGNYTLPMPGPKRGEKEAGGKGAED